MGQLRRIRDPSSVSCSLGLGVLQGSGTDSPSRDGAGDPRGPATPRSGLSAQAGPLQAGGKGVQVKALVPTVKTSGAAGSSGPASCRTGVHEARPRDPAWTPSATPWSHGHTWLRKAGSEGSALPSRVGSECTARSSAAHSSLSPLPGGPWGPLGGLGDTRGSLGPSAVRGLKWGVHKGPHGGLGVHGEVRGDRGPWGAWDGVSGPTGRFGGQGAAGRGNEQGERHTGGRRLGAKLQREPRAPPPPPPVRTLPPLRVRTHPPGRAPHPPREGALRRLSLPRGLPATSSIRRRRKCEAGGHRSRLRDRPRPRAATAPPELGLCLPGSRAGRRALIPPGAAASWPSPGGWRVSPDR